MFETVEMKSELQKDIEAVGFVSEAACSSEIISLYPIERVCWAAKTEFAEAIIAEVPGFGKTLFLDKEIQSAEADEAIYHETLVHPVMLSAPCRHRVLVIGGGEGATVREVLKWSDVQKVVWIDIDGELVEACKEHLKWGIDPLPTHVTFKAMDIHDFFKVNQEQFDVILIDLPDPDISESPTAESTLQNLRFWRGLNRTLAPTGVFATHCGPIRFSHGTDNGINWVRKAARLANCRVEGASEFHTVIPSFQDDWAFIMSCPRAPFPAQGLPFSVRFMTPQAYAATNTWAYPVRSADS